MTTKAIDGALQRLAPSVQHATAIQKDLGATAKQIHADSAAMKELVKEKTALVDRFERCNSDARRLLTADAVQKCIDDKVDARIATSSLDAAIESKTTAFGSDLDARVAVARATFDSFHTAASEFKIETEKRMLDLEDTVLEAVIQQGHRTVAAIKQAASEAPPAPAPQPPPSPATFRGHPIDLHVDTSRARSTSDDHVHNNVHSNFGARAGDSARTRVRDDLEPKFSGGPLYSPRNYDHAARAQTLNTSQFDIKGMANIHYHCGPDGTTDLTPEKLIRCGYVESLGVDTDLAMCHNDLLRIHTIVMSKWRAEPTIDTSINLADHFTKPLPRALFHRHVDYIMGHVPPAYSPTFDRVIGDFKNLSKLDNKLTPSLPPLKFTPESFTTPTTAAAARIFAPIYDDYGDNPWGYIVWKCQ